MRLAARCQRSAVSTQLSVQRSASKISRNFFAKCKEVTEEKLTFSQHFFDGADTPPLQGLCKRGYALPVTKFFLSRRVVNPAAPPCFCCDASQTRRLRHVPVATRRKP